jgi:hypothetical protein
MTSTSRAMALLLPNEPMTCPSGHRLPKEFWAIGEDPSGGQRCKHRPPPTGRECGLLVYWILMPGGTRLCFSIESMELSEMESRHMSIEQIRDFLGLNWGGKR